MTEPLTLQALLNAYPPNLAGQPLSRQKRRVCAHLQACRTPRLGGLQLHCNHCGHTQLLYHACRDRHCPQCQYRQREAWCAHQREQVLPVTYHHLVFTLPHELNGWVQLHPDVIYRLLFHATWQTLAAFGHNPKRLGGKLGAILMLHTWGQNLSQHVHLHVIIPGGALTANGDWVAAKGRYLSPVKALSRLFRGKRVSALRQAAQAGELARVTRPGEIDQTLDTLMAKAWVVYSRACLTHTETVIDYLGRYSHRIALSNTRLLGIEAGKVLLRYKDYRAGRTQVMRMRPEELIRRFLLHILPKGFAAPSHPVTAALVHPWTSCVSATTAFSPTAAVESNSRRSAWSWIERQRWKPRGRVATSPAPKARSSRSVATLVPGARKGYSGL